MTKGSIQLTHDIRQAAVTYSKVTAVHLDDGVVSLECGCLAKNSTRNPAYVGQMRYCDECTQVKLRKTGDAA